MTFKYSAIGRNTPENREHLEKVGYKLSLDEDGDTIFTFETGKVAIVNASDIYIVYDEYTNDYRNNPTLFRAVTALRDDSDYMQWFKLRGDKLNRWFLYKEKNIAIDKDWYKKATLSELTEYLK